MLNSNDEWRDVQGYEGRYQVSSGGQVRSIQDNHGRPKNAVKAANKTGTVDYLYVKLFKKDGMVNKAVHRLVAEAFVPNPNDKPMVNHKDGDKRNNSATNLEWVTCSENHKHAFTTGLRNADHVADRNRGQKTGVTSKYRNVTWDKARKKWQVQIKDKGVRLCMKRFDTETDAALYVNRMVKHFGLDRPLNVITEMPNDYPARE